MANFNLSIPCNKQPKCLNCSSHFMQARKNIKQVAISNHFERDIKDKAEAQEIINKILSCKTAEFFELHKFEESIAGIPLFRAKNKSVHIVYAIDKEKIIFLRAIKNFLEYKDFLEKRSEILSLIRASKPLTS